MKKILLLLITTLISGLLFAQLPDFSLTDCKGNSYHLYDDLSNGKAVVLAFGAGWCGPCRESDPLLEKLWEDFDSGACKVNVYLFLFENNTPGVTTNCTYANNYAKQYKLGMPVFAGTGAFYEGLTGQYTSTYQQNSIPFFLVILPNTQDPSASTVKIINDYNPDLVNMFKDSLALGGFMPPPTIDVSGTLCTTPPFSATLTSGFTLPNLWSTSETSQSININQSGVYSVTKDGCTASKYVEFTTPGAATISSSTVCEDGLYTLSYDIPSGSGGASTWQYLDAQSVWQDLAPADLGPITLKAWDPAGTVYTFRVKSVNRTEIDGVNPCEQYSNEVQTTISSATPAIITGTASASVSQTCYGNSYTIKYTGGIANSIWEVYNDQYGIWLPLDYLIDDPSFVPNYYNASYASLQPVTINGYNYMSSVNGNAGNRFRVKSPNATGDCYILSNEVDVSLLPLPDASIIGPDYVCEGSSSITLQVSGNYSSVLWNTGATTNSITVTPAPPVTYSVTVTDANGCVNSNSKDILGSVPKEIPKINASITTAICSGSPVSLSFGGTYSISPCTISTYGQIPATAYSFTTCDGYEIELITDQAYSGSYSVVNVEAGKYYYFASGYANNPDTTVNTITTADGTQVLATGKFYLIYAATTTGQIRFYSAKKDCSADNSVSQARFGLCISDLSLVGTFLWSTGQTTPSISVTPSSTTNYTLTFTDAVTGCTYSSVQQITVGIGGTTENTSSITGSSAVFNWTSAANPDQWQLQYKGIAPGDKWVDIPLLAGTTRSYMAPGLKASQSYNWHIRAKCGKSWTLYSNAITFKTLAKSGAATISDPVTRNQLQLLEGFSIHAAPNPASNSFNITISSDESRTMIMLHVFDQLGRMIEVQRIPPNATIKIGELYRPGTYYIQASQGGRHKEATLIKVKE